MEIRTLVVMILTAVLVWGGFVFFLVKALKSERRRKTKNRKRTKDE